MAKPRKHARPPPRAVPTPEPAFPAPTPEFRRHHATLKPEISRDKFVPHWSVTSRFMGLDPDKPTVDAATWWRNIWDIAAGVRAGRPMERVDGGSANDGISASQLTAHATLRAVAADLGRTYTTLLVYSLVMDMPWTEIGTRLGCDYRTAQTFMRQALVALVGAYDRLGGGSGELEWEG